MIKKYFVGLLQVLVFLLFAINYTFAQCSSGSTILDLPTGNGSVVVNGNTLTVTTTGDVTMSPEASGTKVCSAVWGVGQDSGPVLVGSTGSFGTPPTATNAWSYSINFSTAVNNLVFVLAGAGAATYNNNENFVFTSNAGSVSISSSNSCYSTIVGNTIYSNQNYQPDGTGGGGYFTISAPTAFTQLTISGAGGWNGSTFSFCRNSIPLACNNPTGVSVSPASQTVVQNGTPTDLAVSATGATSYQWYSNSANSNTGGTLITGATNATYTPPTNSTGTMYYYAVATNTCGSTNSSAVSVSVSAPYCSDNSISAPILTNATITGTTIDLNTLLAEPVPVGWTAQWFISTTPIFANAVSSSTVTATSTATNYYVFYAYFNGATYCYGNSSKVTVISNNCPTSTVNLDTLPHSTAPTGSALVWYTTKTRDIGTKTNNTTTVGNGTYWPFFFDEINGCYSPVGNPVVVSNSNCTKEVFINCPDTTYNLNNLTVSVAPSGSTLQWHTVNTGFVQSGAGQTLVSNPATVSAGTYYPVFFDSINGCYSPSGNAVIVKNNCVKEVTNTCPETSYNLTLLTVTPSAPSGSILQWYTVNTGFVQSGTGQTLVNNPTAVLAGTYYPVFFDSINGCYSPAGTAVHVSIQACPGGCYKPGILDAGNTYPTNHGISAFGRAGENNGNWPMVRESAWTVLEAKTKGFVINRIKTTAEVNALPEPVEGMVVYDVEADCLKLYTSKDNGLTFGWYCFTTPACPD